MDTLNNLTHSLTAKFGTVLPGVLGAFVILLIGFFVARIVKGVAKRLLSKTSIDERLGSKIDSPYRIDSFVAKLLYYLVIIYTLIIVLDMLGVNNVLEPLQDMVSKFIGYLPNVIAAGIIAFAGYMISKMASEATGFLSERLEVFGDRIGLNGSSLNITKIVKQIVFVLIFIPILIVALDTLKMTAISEPATEMLSQLLNAIPQILAAAILIGVFYIAGKYVVAILVDLLKNVGMDKFSNQLGVSSIIGNSSMSQIVGNVVLFFIIFTGLIAAADKLELTQVQAVLNDVLHIGGRVFFGVLVLLGGILVSNIAVNALSQSENNSWMIPITRFAILGIFIAFSLHTMGIAESIVNLAFGLTLGAIAVAFALSFGLGGREAAGKQMDHFLTNMRKEK